MYGCQGEADPAKTWPAAWSSWGGRPTPARLTEGPSPSPDRSRNAASSNGGFKNFRTEGHAIPDVAQAAIG